MAGAHSTGLVPLVLEQTHHYDSLSLLVTSSKDDRDHRSKLRKSAKAYNVASAEDSCSTERTRAFTAIG